MFHGFSWDTKHITSPAGNSSPFALVKRWDPKCEDPITISLVGFLWSCAYQLCAKSGGTPTQNASPNFFRSPSDGDGRSNRTCFRRLFHGGIGGLPQAELKISAIWQYLAIFSHTNQRSLLICSDPWSFNSWYSDTGCAPFLDPYFSWKWATHGLSSDLIVIRGNHDLCDSNARHCCRKPLGRFAILGDLGSACCPIPYAYAYPLNLSSSTLIGEMLPCAEVPEASASATCSLECWSGASRILVSLQMGVSNEVNKYKIKDKMRWIKSYDRNKFQENTRNIVWYSGKSSKLVVCEKCRNEKK